MSNLNEVFFMLSSDMKRKCEIFDNLSIRGLSSLRQIEKDDDKYIYNTNKNRYRIKFCCDSRPVNFGNYSTIEEARKYRNAIIDYIYFVNL